MLLQRFSNSDASKYLRKTLGVFGVFWVVKVVN